MMDIVEKRLDLPINSAGKYALHHGARAGCRNELCRGETYLRYVKHIKRKITTCDMREIERR